MPPTTKKDVSERQPSVLAIHLVAKTTRHVSPLEMNFQRRVSFVVCLWLASVAILVLCYRFLGRESLFMAQGNPALSADILETLQDFMSDWCRVHRVRTDVESVLKSCQDDLSWNNVPLPGRGVINRTDARRSEIGFFDIRPAGEFSRVVIQTKTSDGRMKSIGGDFWRILLRGPATISPTVFDLGDGSYEVLFLVVEAGVYKLDITLDYSLCDGYRDPPEDWFIIGNSQGKMQKNGVLGGRAKEDVLLKSFQGGKLIMINIPLPRNAGIFLFNSLREFHKYLEPQFDLSCDVKCKFMWDGYGRWVDGSWRPYLKEVNSVTEPSNLTTERKSGALWLYGDSQADRLYESIKDGPLCTQRFRSCDVRKMWVYPYTKELPSPDDEDFQHEKIVEDLRSALERSEMDENSVLILNLGLHYAESVNFSDYKLLMRAVVKLLKEKESSGELEHKTRIIWKTTTSISKEKDTGDQLKSDRRRFLTLPRVYLYNAFATDLMCRSGFEVIDVFTFTSSYPEGTGGPEVGWYKEKDIVHFKYSVTKPIDYFLEHYFYGRISLPISLSYYEFA